MERKNTGYLIAVIALAIAVVGMSIGFAFSDIELTIKGDTVTAKGAKWDIHFNPDYGTSGSTVTTGSVTGTPVLSENNTVATYSVTLNPGEFYEFKVSAKNFGTYDAKLTKYELTTTTSPTDATNANVTHTLKRNGTIITPGVQSGTTLAPNASDEYTVRVDYAKPENASDLVAQDITYTFTIVLTYSEVTA